MYLKTNSFPKQIPKRRSYTCRGEDICKNTDDSVANKIKILEIKCSLTGILINENEYFCTQNIMKQRNYRYTHNESESEQ